MDKIVYIITGGILTTDLIKSIKPNNIIIGVDKAVQTLLERNIIPDYMIGDFDSIDPIFFDKIKQEYSEKIKKSPAVKDETDTELALRTAISLNPSQIVILGAIGTRLDHVIANIHLLIQSEQQNIKTVIEGTSNRVTIILPGQTKKIRKSLFKYVSMLPFTGEVTGVYLKGFKYSLENSILKPGYPVGVSNEIIEEVGTISIKKGILLIIESKD